MCSAACTVTQDERLTVWTYLLQGDDRFVGSTVVEVVRGWQAVFVPMTESRIVSFVMIKVFIETSWTYWLGCE